MSWKKVKLGEFLHHRKGKYKPDDLAIAGLKRVNKIDFSGKIFLSSKDTKTDMILIKPGDLLISGINVEKGAMCVYQGEEDVVATIHYSAYEFDNEKIDIEFLKFFLKSAAFKKALKEQVPGGIKTEIKPKHLLPLLVEVPTDVEEQRQIVQHLKAQEEKFNLLSEELSSQFSLLKKLRQSLLQDAVQGKLVPQDATDEPAEILLQKIKGEKEALVAAKKIKKEKPLPPIPENEVPFEVPEGWVWCRLGEIGEIMGGITLGKRYNEKVTAHPYLRVANVQRGYINLNELKELAVPDREFEKTVLQNNDLLIIEGNGSQKEIGRCAIWKNQVANCMHQNHIIRVRASRSFLAEYVLNFLNCPSGTVQMRERAITTTGLFTLSISKLSSLLIPLPPLAEQHRIVQKLESLMATCDALEESIRQSQEEANQLLQTALREALQVPSDANVLRPG